MSRVSSPPLFLRSPWCQGNQGLRVGISSSSAGSKSTHGRRCTTSVGSGRSRQSTIGSVSSTLAFFADPKVAVPFLLWALRLLANIRAMSASISAMKEDRHNLEIEPRKKEEVEVEARCRQKRPGGGMLARSVGLGSSNSYSGETPY